MISKQSSEGELPRPSPVNVKRNGKRWDQKISDNWAERLRHSIDILCYALVAAHWTCKTNSFYRVI